MAASEQQHEVPGTSGLAGTAPDTAPRPAGPAHEGEPSAQRGGRLGRWVLAAAVTVVVAALAAVLLGRAGLSAGGGGASTSWQPYHDPFGLFTLRAPPGWAAHFEPSTGTFGDRYGSETERVDSVTFNDPTQGTGSAFMLVIAHPITTAFDHQYYCLQPANLQSFAPATLSSMEPSGVWLFTTENAYFQVDVGIPGVVMPTTFGPPPPPATPIPSTWAATDKSEVNAMLVSFQPTDPKPLTC
jgi:hypothetical protein